MRLIGVLALVAPVALGILLIAAPGSPLPGGPPGPLVAAVAAAAAGVSLTALVVAGYLRFRFDSMVRAAERIAAGDYTTSVTPRRHGLEARLSRAVNAIADALADTHDRATMDRLTGVANRPSVVAALFSEVERAGRYERPLSVAFVDIDHFKSINDTYGHAAGDVVLRGVAQTIGANLRASDLIGRYGGEEFMIILAETGLEEGSVLAEKLRMLVQRQRFVVDGRHEISVTISIGIAGGTGRLHMEDLVRDADAAMYSAKSLGRNQTYIFAEPDDDARVPRAPISAAGRAYAVEIGQRARDAATEALTSALVPLPHYGGRPSALIASIVVTLARQLQLPPAEVDRLRIAALLHDVGKIAVPPDILDKPSALTSTEWRTMVQHPRIGQVILEQAAALKDAVPIILHHHERYAGRGYPFGLRATEIPLGARIVAIADAYDAMVHDRPYRAARSHHEAIAELRRHAGTQFDPELVELFCDLYGARPPEVEAAAVEAAAGTHRSRGGPLEISSPARDGRRRRSDMRPTDAAADGPTSIRSTGEAPSSQTMAADGALGMSGSSSPLPAAANSRRLPRRPPVGD